MKRVRFLYVKVRCVIYMKIVFQKNGLPWEKDKFSRWKGFPYEIVWFTNRICFLCKKEKVLQCKKNGFPLWKSLLYEIVCYMKGMNFSCIWRVFPCELVCYVKIKSFPCERGFSMWMMVSLSFWVMCSHVKISHIGEGPEECPMWRGEGPKECP